MLFRGVVLGLFAMVWDGFLGGRGGVLGRGCGVVGLGVREVDFGRFFELRNLRIHIGISLLGDLCRIPPRKEAWLRIVCRWHVFERDACPPHINIPLSYRDV